MNTSLKLAFSQRWVAILGSLLFALSHTQPPLYYSNQNQYFLHAAARAGIGDLRTDWLANTKDPTVLFTLGAQFLLENLGTWSIQLVFFGLLMLYFRSLWAIAIKLPYAPLTVSAQWFLAGLLISCHSGILRAASVEVFGIDYPWYFQAGVANQYLLGAGIQPSVFGVLLLTALACVMYERYFAAAACIVFTCWIHPTYLLPGALLTIGLLAAMLNKGDVKTSLSFAGLTLIGVLPIVIYSAISFRSETTDEFQQSQFILATVRIPHHCDINRWLDWVAVVQIMWVGFGLFCLRDTRLYIPLAIAAGLAVALTLVQYFTQNNSLALLFPWRLSAVLVPVATVLIAVRLIYWMEYHISTEIFLSLGLILIVVAVVGAAVVNNRHLGYQSSEAENGLQEFVTAHRKPGEVYLLPASFPKAPPKPGSSSSTFVPVKQTGRPAIFELQRFRLITGAATYIDFKSIPYRDTEVLEWYRRVQACEKWYDTPDWDMSNIIAAIRAEGITHVVVPAGVEVTSRHLKLEYEDPAYRVFRIE